MLAELALQTGPPLPALGGRLDSRTSKIGLALGLCLGGIAVLFAGAIIVTAVFG